MRVGIISDALYPHGRGTGASHYITNFLTHLSRIDRENEFILFHRVSSPNPFYEQYKHVEYGQYSSVVPLPFFVSWEVALAKALKENPVDLMHEPAGLGLPLLSWPPRNIITMHDAMVKLFPRRFPLRSIVEFKTRAPLMVWKADRIIAPSENSGRDIENEYFFSKGKVRVIPHGVASDFTRKSATEVSEALRRLGISRPYVLMHAVHRWNKNTIGAVQIYHRATQIAGTREFCLVLSGGMTPELESHVRETIASYGIANDAVLTGFVDDKDVPLLLSGASVFLYPALHEGFGFPILEAMTCGVPIVASSIPTTLEILGDAGLLAPPNDTESLARHLVAAMTDRGLASRMGEKALQQSRKYSVERAAHGVSDVYREVLQHEPRWRV